MSKREEMQAMIRRYKDDTGEREVDMKEVVRHAHAKYGWPLPKPVDPFERLARDFAEAAREEVRHDKETGLPYRANHVYQVYQQGDIFNRWVDIDEAPRGPMHMSLTTRRNQVIGDVLQLTLDAEHWNRVNPKEDPIIVPPDFTEDVEERKHLPVDA